ncbi:hypothetical protein BSN82_17135, partial [Acinetobacter baylyi]
MANAILDFFSSKAFDNNFKISPSQLKDALRRSANDVKVVDGKKVGLGLKISSKATIDEIKNEINKNESAISQFGKLFSEGIQNKYFKGVTKTGKLKISAEL